MWTVIEMSVKINVLIYKFKEINQLIYGMKRVSLPFCNYLCINVMVMENNRMIGDKLFVHTVIENKCWKIWLNLNLEERFYLIFLINILFTGSCDILNGADEIHLIFALHEENSKWNPHFSRNLWYLIFSFYIFYDLLNCIIRDVLISLLCRSLNIPTQYFTSRIVKWHSHFYWGIFPQWHHCKDVSTVCVYYVAEIESTSGTKMRKYNEIYGD